MNKKQYCKALPKNQIGYFMQTWQLIHIMKSQEGVLLNTFQLNTCKIVIYPKSASYPKGIQAYNQSLITDYKVVHLGKINKNINKTALE